MIYIIKDYQKDIKSLEYVSKILQKYYHIENPKFTHNQYHKPYLSNNKYYFSLSHTQNIIVIIIDSNEVGIDIETIRPFNEGVAKKLFNNNELGYVERNNYNFTEVFVCKESYLKYLGTGLSDDAKNIDVLNNQQINTLNIEDYIIATTNANDLTISYKSHKDLFV